MKPTKESILAAIVLLIRGYKDHTLGHLISSCPLCISFYHDEGIIQCTEECGKCPNVSFAISHDRRGCIERGRLIHTLSYDFESNDINLAEFWTRVHKLYQDTPEEDILTLREALQEDIKIIALTFKKDEPNETN